jgi:hypothetical protein
MTVSADILATYRAPGQVIGRLLRQGPREDRALAWLMGFCALMFIAQMPRLAREAELTGQDLNMMLGGALLAWGVIAPLALYGLAGLSYLAGRVLRRGGDAYGARVVLFWSLLASTPLVLLNGLVAGIIGDGAALRVVGFAWLAVFCWFWLSGLRQTGGQGA